jgi:hypothetical protein
MEHKQGQWLNVFCPGARCLTDVEVAALPEEMKNQEGDEEGLWLGVFCPDESCLNGEERAFSIQPGESQVGREGVWLNLFCPNGSCQISGGMESV